MTGCSANKNHFYGDGGKLTKRAFMTTVKIPVKIICGCGQKYAFDVYPVDGRMPATVSCPVCGKDGTGTANEIIALALGVQSVPAMLETVADAWRQRALKAEQRTEQVLAEARASLAPHLAQVLKESLVQELASQRKELLQAQQIAAAEIAQLTHHLDEVRAPVQERLRSYEMRIQELEKELAARTKENRELLKLKIEMMRHQVEFESTRNRMEFN
jgi:DNA repair exonuclease SbcCD ATPase subunit